jgi:signal transduction histidine kinase
MLDKVRRSSGVMRRQLEFLLEEPSKPALFAMRFARTDLREVVTAAIDLFEQRAKAKGIALEFRLADGELVARCDGGRVLEVLTNLLDNSVKFTPVGGRIEVVAEEHGDHLILSVTDSGPGVPSGFRERIFDRGWRGGDAQGKGLGLYIARQIIEGHGGRIWVDDAAAGSSFRFVLPKKIPLPTA